MSMMPFDRPQRHPFDDDFFTLGAPVGPGQPNRREDVIKIETILGNTGHHDLAKTDGPLGWWSERPESAVKAWQGQNGLKVDGLLKPNGPTITSLKQAAGGLLGGFKPPSPDEVDEHHGRLAQGEPGLLNTRPARLSIRVPEQPPELDEQSLAFNADSARALTRTSVDGDVPNIYANYLKQAGADGHTTVLDLVEQVNNAQGRDRAERVLHGILGQLPPDQAKAFLGGEAPAKRPIGVRMADLADDEKVPLFARAATADAPKPVQFAQADTGTMTDAAPADVPAQPPVQVAQVNSGTVVDAQPGSPPAPPPSAPEGNSSGGARPQHRPQSAGSSAEGQQSPAQSAGASKPAPARDVNKIKETIDTAVANGQHVSAGADKGSQECVALVKAVRPDLGPTKDWKAGAQVSGSAALEPGDAIGSGFDANGNYRSLSTGNHAAVVTDVKRDKSGNILSVTIADQYAARPGRKAQPARIRTLSAEEARKYSVINRK